MKQDKDKKTTSENKSEVISAAEINQLTDRSDKDLGGASSLSTVQPQGARAKFKVKFALKLFAFALSVVTLSWFFEGARQIQVALTLSAVLHLLAGSIFTVALIGVQAFFIYAEEKSKDNRTRKIPLFDKLYYKLAGNNSDREGDKTNRG